MKYFFILVFFMVSTQLIRAQGLRIVKDNVNCSYGIKDNEGNWVIEPTYILIQQYNSGYFLMKDIDGDGILKPNGEWLIDCKYDRVQPTNTKWGINNYGGRIGSYQNRADTYFRCFKGEDQDLVTFQGLKIASMGKNDKFLFDGSEHILVYLNSPKRSTYIDTLGTVLISQMQGRILPFGDKESTLVGDDIAYQSDIVSGNTRLINKNGEVLFEDDFDGARFISPGKIVFEQNNRHGLMTTSGEIIIPPKFRWENRFHALGGSGDSWVIYNSENKVGRMRRDGSILIEPYYDDMTPVYTRGIYPDEIWRVKKDGKVGILDTAQNFLIPLEYDRIYPAYTRDKMSGSVLFNFYVEKNGEFAYLLAKNDYLPIQFYDSLEIISDDSQAGTSHCIGLITKKNGKYGILNANGTERVACIYTHHFKRSRYLDDQFFSKGKELDQFKFSTSGIEKITWSPFIIDGEINFYTDLMRPSAFIFSENFNAFVGMDKVNGDYEMNDHLFIIRPQYPNDWRIYSIKTKGRIPINNIKDIYKIREGNYQVRMKNNLVGVMNSRGKLILDAEYTSIETNRNSPHIWAAKSVGDYVSKWILMDTNGRQVLPNLFDDHFEVNSSDQIVSQNYRKGLIDSETLRWKIRPNYHCLFRSVGDYYFVLSETNKKGIIRCDGELILQPIYDSIVLLNSNAEIGSFTRGEPHEIYWLVQKGSTEMLVDESGRKITSPETIRERLASLFFVDTLLFDQPSHQRIFPSLDYSPTVHFLRGLTPEQIRRKYAEVWSNPELKQSVFDTILALWKTRTEPPKSMYGISTYSFVWGTGNQSSEKEMRLQQRCNWAQSPFYRATMNVNFQLKSIGPQFVCVNNQGQTYAEYFGYGEYQAPKHYSFNFVMKDGVVVDVQLKDIFPDDDILMQEFITALKKRDDLKLNCSSVENMLAMVDGNFSLSEEGVYLNLNQRNPSTNTPVELLIPIENLSKLLSTKWIVPILSAEYD